MWHDVEPAIREWVAEGDTLTEQDWQEVPEAARVLYEGLIPLLSCWEIGFLLGR